MKKILISLLLLVFLTPPLYAAQSTITEAEGYACMGDDKSRKQTEQSALADAQRKAAEFALTYIRSETKVKDFVLEKDMIEAYAKATVKVIQEMEKSWYKDPASGDCFRLKVKAEVVPDEKAMKKISRSSAIDDPSGLLHVKLWTDKKEYKAGDQMKIFIKSNKPFFGRIVYKDASGSLLQLLPNPYRTENYFNGGVIYEIPSGKDTFTMEVTPPFGKEEIVVYASTAELGALELKSEGGIYSIQTKSNDIGAKTRGIKIKELKGGISVQGKEVPTPLAASEFFEEKLEVYTAKSGQKP